MLSIEELPPIRPRRRIRGMAEVLLPRDERGGIDWEGFAAHVLRSADAGLTPAICVNAGCAVLFDDQTRREVLRRTGEVLAGREFVAGAAVADQPGDTFRLKAYLKQIEAIDDHGGIPLVFQSYGLAHQDAEHVVNDYEAIAACCERFLASEISEQFDPCGRIYNLGVFEALLEIPQCIGARHASFRRTLEWRRLKLRNRVRPDFLVLSGNELALDMVTYGSDYLLGVSTFGPDWFALRDRLWQCGDARFYEVNDLLQSLASFAFRDPMPAWRHSAAQFLKLRGWIGSDRTHPHAASRPASDVDVLRNLLIAIETYVDEIEERRSETKRQTSELKGRPMCDEE